MIEKTFYGKYNGKDITLFTLKGDGIEVGITDFGGVVTFIKVNTKAGIKDVCLGFNSAEDYINSGTYCGAVIGRCGNRIAKGKFALEGREYSLETNDGNNHLHGGFNGFDKRFFKSRIDNDTLILSYRSKDGEEGYPGNLDFTVEYSLVGTALNIKFKAVSDRTTLWNPTSHIYFNLGGEDKKDILSDELKINADYYSVVDSELIPTGENKAVKGTAFDFTTSKKLGRDLYSDEVYKIFGGYDHNFVLNGNHAVSAYNEDTGAGLEVYTDMPCMQLYSGGAIKSCQGKTRSYGKFSGYCLEPQYMPDAINLSGVEKPIIEKNKAAEHYIRYEFKL